MAKKRETKRERRDEAKRRRLEELRRRQRRDRARKIGIGSVVAAVILGIILLITLLGGGADLDPAAARTAGCDPVQSPAIEGSTHVQPPVTVNYKTIPPTSGNHYGSTTQTGIYDVPVQNEVQVHNLEHGHVVFQYQPGLDISILEGIAAIVKDNRTYAIMAPNPNMRFQLAFSAWGKLQGCQTPNAQAVGVARDFFNAFKDKGPERGLPGQPRPADAPLPTGSPTASPTGSPAPSPTPTT